MRIRGLALEAVAYRNACGHRSVQARAELRSFAPDDRVALRQHLREAGQHERGQLRVRQRGGLAARRQELTGRELSVVLDPDEHAGRGSIVTLGPRP